MRVTLRSKTFIGAAMVAALVAGPVLTGTAAARKARESVQASTSSGKFKANKRKLMVGSYEPTVHVFTLTGVSQKRRGFRVNAKVLQFGCSVDLAAATFPVTVGCGVQYTETGFNGRTPYARGWAGDALNVTFTGFDGSRATGTFEGTLVDSSGGQGPITFSAGQFSIDTDF